MKTKAARPAGPVLKWAGGKRRLVPDILRRLPEQIDTYYEPFVGGGAVFFSLASQGRFRRAVLSDRNEELVRLYKTIQARVGDVLAVLERYEHCEKFYYELRDRDPTKLDAPERAARLIYLNKTGYNGLYRVNRSGKFNVPFGRYKKPKYYDPEGLEAAARALQTSKIVRIVKSDFEKACDKAGPGDAVYFDPPYVPVSKTASFTAYDSEEFGEEGHRRLARVFGSLAERGVHVLLSNSDTPQTRKLYENWQVAGVKVTRPINSNASKRGAISELLVMGVEKRSAPKRRATAR